MIRFCSVALFSRNGKTLFLPPRVEVGADRTQARKAASRHWAHEIHAPDRLLRVIVVEASGAMATVSQRSPSSRTWSEHRVSPNEVADRPHLAACLVELGIRTNRNDEPPPATLVINGWVYQRAERQEDL